MTQQPSLGALSTLPRELRDQIYRHLFVEKVYIVFGQSFWQRQPDPDLRPSIHYPRIPADLAILRTSKTVGKEAEKTMYEQGVFRYSIQFYEQNYGSAPSQRQANRMRKVEFFMAMDLWYDCCESHYEYNSRGGLGEYKQSSTAGLTDKILAEATMNDLVKVTFGRFSGSAALQHRACCIKFLDLHEIFIPEIVMTAFLQAITRMMGFTTIAIEARVTCQEAWPGEMEGHRRYPMTPGSFLGLEDTIYEDDGGESSWRVRVNKLNGPYPMPSPLLREWTWNAASCLEGTVDPKFLHALGEALIPAFGPVIEEGNASRPVKILYSRHRKFMPSKYNAQRVDALGADNLEGEIITCLTKEFELEPCLFEEEPRTMV